MRFMDMMNALQIMCFMTMINQRFPANAQFFVNTLINILNVDILSPDLINNWLFNFKYDHTLVQILNDHRNKGQHNFIIPPIEEMGFETYNSILNL